MQTAYSKITVTVPVGTGAGHLTQASDFTTITPEGEYADIRSGRTPPVTVQPQGFALQVTDQGGKAISFGPGDYMVLTLENVTVAPTARLGTGVDQGRRSLHLLRGRDARAARICLPGRRGLVRRRGHRQRRRCRGT